MKMEIEILLTALALCIGFLVGYIYGVYCVLKKAEDEPQEFIDKYVYPKDEKLVK